MSETIVIIFKDCSAFEDLWNCEVVKIFDEPNREDAALKVDWGVRDVEAEIVRLYDVSRCQQ